jgi:hypothetical protein
MPDRRRFLQCCVTAATGTVAGCFDRWDEFSSETERPTNSETPEDSPEGGDDAVTTTDDDLLYAEEWTEITIEKGSGWMHELPELEESSDLTYSVTAEEPVGFDVYVFAEAYKKETYERWINSPPGMKFETNGIVGLSGATARDVTGSIERTPFVDAGRMWVAVDHSDFDGGFPRAEIDDDSPEAITVDVSIRATAAF